ncbi:hypothetical protein DMA11_08375 [Marinilabiliaceae bacterium JC017]|nr:hypothetical protein DMA11_08375 [Marinilabiliaceae bacterium JC017]
MGKLTVAIYGIQDRLNSATPFYVHDHALTIMQDGIVLKHLTLERLTRKKHDNRLHLLIYDLLKEEGLLAHTDYDLVFVDNVVGRAFISSCGRFRFEGPLNNALSTTVEKGRCWWLDKEKTAYVLNHELAHIGACLPFFGPFKENSLLVHFDGGASLGNFSAWHYVNGQIKPLEFHWDLKYLSGFFNANALVFGIIGAKFHEQNSVPGKVMGLASYGRYSIEMEKWLNAHQYFGEIWHSKKEFYEAAARDWGWNKTHLHPDDPFLQNIVATLQYIFQRNFIAKIEQLQQKTKADYLYYSGGSALNIVVNTALLKSGLFKDVFIPPCTEDSGLAMGAAAFMEWARNGKIKKHSPYLNNWGLSIDVPEYTKEDVDACALALTQGKVIGVCNGFGEVGPRALGNRSILSLANSKKLARKVSMEHKRREWYRPIAPVMLEKNARYFTGKEKIHHLSKLMLLDFEILPQFQKEIEGVVHVNGTARIQTISSREENPFIYDLLEKLDTQYNIKALINTSFNVKGEPIVHTVEGALQSAKNMQLDGVVLNGKLDLF